MLFHSNRSLRRRVSAACCLLLTLLVSALLVAEPADAQTKAQAQAERRLAGKQEVQEALTQLKLPENPSRADCVRFIEKARGYVEQLNALGATLPSEIDATSLNQVPREYVDLLVAEIAKDTRLRFYIPAPVEAMQLEADEIKRLIIKNLDETPANIGVLISNGWCEDARAIITDRILEAQGSVSLDWFAAAVDLNEPKLYRKMHELTIQSKDADAMLAMLEVLPDYDLLNTLQAVMKRIDDGELKIKRKTTLSANNVEELRFKAAENGDLESLAWLVERLPEKAYPYPSLYQFVNVRLPILKLIDFKGDNQETRAWFKENREKLVYDRFRRRFVLQEDDN